MRGRGGAVLAWIGVTIGAVLLVRLLAQAARAIGYGAEWLDEFVLSELVSGLAFSLVDVVIAAIALVGIAWVLMTRR